MIDFNKELEQYKPMIEIKDIEETFTDDDLKDVVDLIKNIINESK